MKKLLLLLSVLLLVACSKENNYKSVDIKITDISPVMDCWLQIHEYDSSNNPVCTNHLSISMGVGKSGYFLENGYRANVKTMKITLEISSEQTGGSSVWYPYPFALGTGYYDYNKGKSVGGDAYYDILVSATDFKKGHDPIWDLN